MPFSSERGKAYIKNIVSHLTHASILDIGAGCGTYGKMFPNAKKTGVEVWPAYIDQYGLKDIYDDLHVADIRSWQPPTYYDVAFAGDVLEHMTREEAIGVFTKLQFCADTVVISIPLGHYPQGEYEGNPYEAHVVDNWSDADVRSAFGEPSYSTIDGEIGVYVYTKQKLRFKIAVYAISKNESMFVERFCKSAELADYVVIGDTGSTDNTAQLAKDHGAIVHDIRIRPWRFDLARNAVLALIPDDVDVCISLDLDEVLNEGWREEIEKVWTEQPDTTNLWYFFDWGAGFEFWYRKIHARHGYHWWHACHEDIRLDPRVQERNYWLPKKLISHYPDPTKSRGQYMDILQASVTEDDRDPQHWFYYSRELTFNYRWEEAKVALHKYLDMPTARNPNERCYAMRTLALTYKNLGDEVSRERWLLQAAGEAPTTREPWCELAQAMFDNGRWPECYAFAMKALSILRDVHKVYTMDPKVWGAWPHDLAGVAAWYMGMKEEAIKQAEIALQHEPENPAFIRNLNWYRNPPEPEDQSN